MREKICTIQGKRAPSKRRNKRHVKKKKLAWCHWEQKEPVRLHCGDSCRMGGNLMSEQAGLDYLRSSKRSRNLEFVQSTIASHWQVRWGTGPESDRTF